jgi:hypothetical protein
MQILTDSGMSAAMVERVEDLLKDTVCMFDEEREFGRFYEWWCTTRLVHSPPLFGAGQRILHQNLDAGAQYRYSWGMQMTISPAKKPLKVSSDAIASMERNLALVGLCLSLTRLRDFAG